MNEQSTLQDKVFGCSDNGGSMKLFVSVLTVICAIAAVSSAEAQSSFCQTVQNGVGFESHDSEELTTLPNIKIVTGTRHFCSSGITVGMLPNQVEIRDANNSCATLFEGQMVPMSGGVVGPSPCPAITNLVYFSGPSARGLLHKATLCPGVSSITVRDFSNGVQATSRPSGLPDCR